MAYAVDDLVARTEQLLDKMSYRWQRCDDEAEATLAIVLPSGHRVRVAIGPLPPERRTHTLFFPRTLLTAHSDDADEAEVGALRHALVIALLRVTG